MLQVFTDNLQYIVQWTFSQILLQSIDKDCIINYPFISAPAVVTFLYLLAGWLCDLWFGPTSWIQSKPLLSLSYAGQTLYFSFGLFFLCTQLFYIQTFIFKDMCLHNRYILTLIWNHSCDHSQGKVLQIISRAEET